MGVCENRAMIAAVVGMALALLSCSQPVVQPSGSWNAKAAAAYLDLRETWWMQWSGSARDHGTFCVSCHTVLPYALARPSLQSALAQAGPTLEERKLIANIDKRVRFWNAIGTYYAGPGPDGKSAQSRGTEAILNAVVLAERDAEIGQLSDDTHSAFDQMWSLQQTEGNNQGAWRWLQFDQEPWEAKQSVYFGACLAALAVGAAPDKYSSTPAIQPNVELLRKYLRRNNTSQSLINRLFLLWAAVKLQGLVNQTERAAIVNAAFAEQQRDGGWRLAEISWNWHSWTAKSFMNMWLREKGTPLSGASDGAATGLVVFALREAGVPQTDPRLQRGISWLIGHETADGDWPTESVNKQKHLSPQTALFMTDAATAYAVLALTYPGKHPGSAGPKQHGD
ncbi:MAG: hypothetical protein ACRD5K_01410 [Candidatus Acidiferrales bacterium]